MVASHSGRVGGAEVVGMEPVYWVSRAGQSRWGRVCLSQSVVLAVLLESPTEQVQKASPAELAWPSRELEARAWRSG